MKRKCLAVGIILFFIGAGVIPSMRGNIVNVNTSDDNIINSATSTAIFFGLIKNMNKSFDNSISFNCIIVYYRAYVDGHLYIATVLTNGFDIDVHYNNKIGIIANHIIFAAFTIHSL